MNKQTKDYKTQLVIKAIISRKNQSGEEATP
jgi:hypothetical protein